MDTCGRRIKAPAREGELDVRIELSREMREVLESIAECRGRSMDAQVEAYVERGIRHDARILEGLKVF